MQDDTCSTLAKLATDALYRGDFDTAAHILATVFIQGARFCHSEVGRSQPAVAAMPAFHSQQTYACINSGCAKLVLCICIAGGECGKAVSDGVHNNIPQLGCDPLLKAVATAYQLAQAAGQGDAFEAGFAAQPALVATVNACLQPQVRRLLVLFRYFYCWLSH